MRGIAVHDHVDVQFSRRSFRSPAKSPNTPGAMTPPVMCDHRPLGHVQCREWRGHTGVPVVVRNASLWICPSVASAGCIPAPASGSFHLHTESQHYSPVDSNTAPRSRAPYSLTRPQKPERPAIAMPDRLLFPDCPGIRVWPMPRRNGFLPRFRGRHAKQPELRARGIETGCSPKRSIP